MKYEAAFLLYQRTQLPPVSSLTAKYYILVWDFVDDVCFQIMVSTLSQESLYQLPCIFQMMKRNIHVLELVFFSQLIWNPTKWQFSNHFSTCKRYHEPPSSEDQVLLQYSKAFAILNQSFKADNVLFLLLMNVDLLHVVCSADSFEALWMHQIRPIPATYSLQVVINLKKNCTSQLYICLLFYDGSHRFRDVTQY